MNDITIPEDVLELKDEACDIIGKAAQAADEQRGEPLAEYGRRLIEIHESLK